VTEIKRTAALLQTSAAQADSNSQSVACAATGGYRAENVHRNSEKAAAIHGRLHAHTWRSTKRDLYVIVGVLVQMLLDAEEHEKDAH
jgi:hypothetical protein